MALSSRALMSLICVPGSLQRFTDHRCNSRVAGGVCVLCQFIDERDQNRQHGHQNQLGSMGENHETETTINNYWMPLSPYIKNWSRLNQHHRLSGKAI